MKEKAYSCSICDRKFHLKANFKSHLKIHSNEKPLKCPHECCFKCSATKAQFINHVRRHNSNFQICNKKIELSIDDLKHLQIFNSQKNRCSNFENNDQETITDESSINNDKQED